jgi:3-oxoacyl-[acyl-carrier protein] reductase
MEEARRVELGLQGKRAVVAGASSGLGLGCAAALAAEGVTVAMGSRNRAKIEAAAAGLQEAVPLVADVSTPEGASAFVEAGIEALGGIDILVANAGGPPPGTFASTPVDAYPDALALNLLSTVAMCQVAVPPMRDQRWGRVVAITSISAREPIPHLILSNTARAGVTGFLKTLSAEVAGDGVTVNSLQPGTHATPRVEQTSGRPITPEAAASMGSPADFGRIATFLCSESARFLSGAAIPVDGGSHHGIQ